MGVTSLYCEDSCERKHVGNTTHFGSTITIQTFITWLVGYDSSFITLQHSFLLSIVSGVIIFITLIKALHNAYRDS